MGGASGSLAVIALILTALGLMLGIVKPADVLKRVGAILGTVIVLLLIPVALANLWLHILLWQRIGFAAIAIGIWRWRRPREQTQKRRVK